ncbi:T9SS type A sorting domain-containing protein [Bacteroidota bacterium]
MKIFTKNLLFFLLSGFLLFCFINNVSSQSTRYFNEGTNNLWSNTANWDGGSTLPSTNDHIVIQSGECLYSGTFTSGDFTINADAGLIYPSSGVNLTIGGDLTVKGGSTTTESGQIVEQVPISITGNTNTELFLQYFDSTGGGLTLYPYHLVSQPTTSALADVFMNFWLYEWDEPNDQWNSLSQGNSLTLGKGYAAYYSGTSNQTVTFPGTHNKADVNGITLHYTGTGSYPGVNLLGNPFPCALDFDDISLLTANSAQANMPSWTYYTLNAAGKNWAVWNIGGPGTNGAKQYIAPMQGFYLVTQTGGGLFDIKKDARIIDFTANFLKESKLTTPYVSLTIKCDSNNYSDETILHIHPQATSGVDFYYDALKMLNPFADVPNIYTTASSNEDLAINAIEPITNTKVIPIHFIAGLGGNYSITASNLTSFIPDFQDLYLEDTQTNIMHNLNQNPMVSFSTAPGTFTNRFMLHLKSSTAGLNELEENQISIYSYGKNVYIAGQENSNAEIKIYSLIGQQVYNGTMNSGMNQITLEEPTGYYIVNLITATSSISEKVFIK